MFLALEVAVEASGGNRDEIILKLQDAFNEAGMEESIDIFPQSKRNEDILESSDSYAGRLDIDVFTGYLIKSNIYFDFSFEDISEEPFVLNGSNRKEEDGGYFEYFRDEHRKVPIDKVAELSGDRDKLIEYLSMMDQQFVPISIYEYSKILKERADLQEMKDRRIDDSDVTDDNASLLKM